MSKTGRSAREALEGTCLRRSIGEESSGFFSPMLRRMIFQILVSSRCSNALFRDGHLLCQDYTPTNAPDWDQRARNHRRTDSELQAKLKEILSPPQDQSGRSV